MLSSNYIGNALYYCNMNSKVKKVKKNTENNLKEKKKSQIPCKLH